VAITTKPGLDAWVGTWVAQEAEITIKRSGDELVVSGFAMWHHQNTGEVNGKARPKGDLLQIGAEETEEDACKVNLQSFGPYLLVDDNQNCGGLNVSFGGTYRRKPTR
jgi:hypothetical protein